MKERYYMSDLRWWVEHGDAAEVLKALPDGSVDALVTDPPAGIGFMGKEWDGSKGGRYKWIAWLTGILAECRRAMKPGAYGWVWALPRTAHWTATACEDAGFAVRDVLVHVFGTGFPKSRSLLKPAQEMWISIQKPLAVGHWILTVSRQLRMLERDLCRTGDLQDAMGTVLSNEVISGCLSTVQSWNNTLAALWHGQSTFTTETVSSQITVLKTLNYSLSQITHESIIQERQNRSLLSVGAVEALFSVLRASLSSTQTLFAVESAIEKATFNAASANELQMDESEQKTGPGSEHWILIKAPGELRELRIEENRIEGAPRLTGTINPHAPSGVNGILGSDSRKDRQQRYDANPPSGRWPANFALSHSDDCADTCADDCTVKVLDEQSGSKAGTRRESDSGCASRFFMTFSGSCGHEKIEAEDTFVGKQAVDSAASLSIGGCGSKRTVPSQKAITSITATEILSTIKLTTLSVCQHRNTGPNTTENENDIGLLMASNSENANDVVNINKFQTSLNDQPELGTDIVDSASGSTSGSGGPRIEITGTNTIVPTDRGGSRFLYQAKPSTRERSAGLPVGTRNTHTTVKSISLMRHLVSLIAAPGSTILDPFTGSGSTGIAALTGGCHFVGIEREAEYVEIARQRIAAGAAKAR